MSQFDNQSWKELYNEEEVVKFIREAFERELSFFISTEKEKKYKKKLIEHLRKNEGFHCPPHPKNPKDFEDNDDNESELQSEQGKRPVLKPNLDNLCNAFIQAYRDEMNYQRMLMIQKLQEEEIKDMEETFQKDPKEDEISDIQENLMDHFEMESSEPDALYPVEAQPDPNKPSQYYENGEWKPFYGTYYELECFRTSNEMRELLQRRAHSQWRDNYPNIFLPPPRNRKCQYCEYRPCMFAQCHSGIQWMCEHPKLKTMYDKRVKAYRFICEAMGKSTQSKTLPLCLVASVRTLFPETSGIYADPITYPRN